MNFDLTHTVLEPMIYRTRDHCSTRTADTSIYLYCWHAITLYKSVWETRGGT